jgi:hypothetical protein
VNAVKAMLKAAEEQRTKQQVEQLRLLHVAERRDPRPRINVPPEDAPWLPQMDVLNDVLGGSTASRPPVRDIEGVMTRAGKLSAPGMHAFADANTEDNTDDNAKLPPPEHWLLMRMNEMECAEAIEEYIDYVKKDDEGGRSVHLPMKFVRHFLQRRDRKLPIAAAISTLPLVMPDGKLLVADGLDRLRGIIFEIPKELLVIIPRQASDKDVRAAMEFLCSEWLCDVSASFTDKCVIIAAALTLIERSLVSDRPVFFVSAGRRGCGKTTLLIMLIMAVLGARPAAAAWSTVEEERRKALFSYLIYGAPYILWDNITRGTQVWCPHVERACTSATYIDRKLGVTEAIATAASTIHFFTGNNIAPKGDLTSRSLHIRLKVDRPDPENREFKHPDPVGWTEDRRAKILAALYTVLIGNPMLKRARNAACKTRFKPWWRLVGAAVEHGAEVMGKEVDFQELFMEQDEDDEEAASLADALAIMEGLWPDGFKAEDVAKLANKRLSKDGGVLRGFLFGEKVPPSFEATAMAVALRLKLNLDETVWSGKRQLTLRAYRVRENVLRYYVHGK